MSIWGKILGGAAGFAFGGPIGALLGLAAGHAVDRLTRAGVACGTADDKSTPGADPARSEATQSIAFTIGVIALAAKMARADGVVKRVEIDTFQRLFRVPPEELENVGRVFDLARRDTHGFEDYARQIAALFEHRHAVLEELLDSLLMIAEADDDLHEAEVAYLHAVARIFGFSDAEFERILAGRPVTGAARGGEGDPYGVLGLTRAASDAEVKATHRQLVREHHPDQLIAQGMPQEFIDLATRKLAAINAAHDRIVKERARRPAMGTP